MLCGVEVQTQVACRLRSDPDQLRAMLGDAVSEGGWRVGVLVDRVCEAFDLRDGRGRWQRVYVRFVTSCGWS